jgi:hypothetical protein
MAVLANPVGNTKTAMAVLANPVGNMKTAMAVLANPAGNMKTAMAVSANHVGNILLSMDKTVNPARFIKNQKSGFGKKQKISDPYNIYIFNHFKLIQHEIKISFPECAQAHRSQSGGALIYQYIEIPE